MPRTARIVAQNLPYHITQRGNYRQNVFQDNEDRLCYLSCIKDYSKKHKLSVFVYCLMDNHVHFIAVPRKEDLPAKVFSISHMRYSQYFNKKKKASGHLWQGRFYSCVLDEPYLMAATVCREKPCACGNCKEGLAMEMIRCRGSHGTEKRNNLF